MAAASSAQLASGLLEGGQAVGAFVNAQRTASAIIAQSDFDRKLADMQAEDAIARGNVEARRVEIATTGEVGRARATMAAQGLDLSSGSALDVQAQDAALGHLDAQTIRNNAIRVAMGYTTQAALDALGAKSKARAIRSQSFETLATGAARTYGIFKKGTISGVSGKGPKIGGSTSASSAPSGDDEDQII